MNNSGYLGVLINGFKAYNCGIKLDHKIFKNTIELIPRGDFI